MTKIPLCDFLDDLIYTYIRANRDFPYVIPIKDINQIADKCKEIDVELEWSQPALSTIINKYGSDVFRWDNGTLIVYEEFLEKCENLSEFHSPYSSDEQESKYDHILKDMVNSRRPLIYAIDFDGTIAETQFPDILGTIPKVVDFIKAIQSRGDNWILLTNREGEALNAALAWLKNLGLCPNAINDNVSQMKEFFNGNPRKPFANFYISEFTGEWECVSDPQLDDVNPDPTENAVKPENKQDAESEYVPNTTVKKADVQKVLENHIAKVNKMDRCLSSRAY